MVSARSILPVRAGGLLNLGSFTDEELLRTRRRNLPFMGERAALMAAFWIVAPLLIMPFAVGLVVNLVARLCDFAGRTR